MIKKFFNTIFKKDMSGSSSLEVYILIAILLFCYWIGKG
jgi:hypothetical protein